MEWTIPAIIHHEKEYETVLKNNKNIAANLDLEQYNPTDFSVPPNKINPYFPACGRALSSFITSSYDL